MSLYLKYRPANLAEVKGNADILVTLGSMLDKLETCPHAFLLHGPTGCGKTTLGRIIANRLGCTGYDFKEINSADFRGIDAVRDMIKSSQYMAMESPAMVWMIDEVQKLTNEAQNALLKILEDTPSHVYFILCTTDPQKLLATIKGRCSIFQVMPLNEPQMRGLLKKVVKEEGETIDSEIYDQIIVSAKGHPRNALQILEQVLNVPAERRMEVAKKVEAEAIQSIELCRAIIGRKGWKAISEILTGLKDQDPEAIRRVMLGYCQSILLSGKDEPLCGLIMEEFVNPYFEFGFPQLTYACYSVFKNQ